MLATPTELGILGEALAGLSRMRTFWLSALAVTGWLLVANPGVAQAQKATKNQKFLLYRSATVQTSVNLISLERKKLNSTIGADRQVELERLFPDFTGQLAIAEIACPNQLEISQVYRYGKKGRRISAIGGDRVILLEPREARAVLHFLCSKSPQINAPPGNGNCALPWQRDSRGRRCGDRIPGRYSTRLGSVGRIALSRQLAQALKALHSPSSTF